MIWQEFLQNGDALQNFESWQALIFKNLPRWGRGEAETRGATDTWANNIQVNGVRPFGFGDAWNVLTISSFTNIIGSGIPSFTNPAYPIYLLEYDYTHLWELNPTTLWGDYFSLEAYLGPTGFMVNEIRSVAIGALGKEVLKSEGVPIICQQLIRRVTITTAAQDLAYIGRVWGVEISWQYRA